MGDAQLFALIAGSMGLVWGLYWLVRWGLRGPKLRNPVAGTLHLTGATARRGEGTGWTNCTVAGVIEAPGLPPTPVSRQIAAHTRSWPTAGQTLPVQVESTDASRFRVDWDAVPRPADVARQQAADLANQLSGPAWGRPPQDQTPMDGPPWSVAPSSTGRPGTGQVTSYIEQPGDTVTVRFDLLVRLDDGSAPFAATLTAGFAPSSGHLSQLARVGASIPVRFDPAVPGRVQLDLDRL